MSLYWVGWILGFVSGFWFGKAFEVWLRYHSAHSPKDKD